MVEPLTQNSYTIFIVDHRVNDYANRKVSGLSFGHVPRYGFLRHHRVRQRTDQEHGQGRVPRLSNQQGRVYPAVQSNGKGDLNMELPSAEELGELVGFLFIAWVAAPFLSLFFFNGLTHSEVPYTLKNILFCGGLLYAIRLGINAKIVE